MITVAQALTVCPSGIIDEFRMIWSPLTSDKKNGVGWPTCLSLSPVLDEVVMFRLLAVQELELSSVFTVVSQLNKRFCV